MPTRKPIPPPDLIREDSGPTITETETPNPPIDIDDAQIEEPRDDVFKKKDPPKKSHH